MIKKTEAPDNSVASGSKPLPQVELFSQLDALLMKHLSAEQTKKVVAEFRKVSNIL